MRWWPGPLTVRTRLTLWYSAILLAILLTISALSYSLLRWHLMQDLDASLLAVAQVVRDTGYAAAPATPADDVDAALRRLLGAELYDALLQFLDPDGDARFRSRELGGRSLPLSLEARRNAARGTETFETVRLVDDGWVRLLTVPVVRDGRARRLVQVAIPLDRTQRALARYVQTLLWLVPLAVGLAALGGAAVARAALRPVDGMSTAARQISAEDLSRRLTRRGTDDELDRLADTLNGMLARLEAAFGGIRRFAADAAHELRTPLTALKGGLEVALRADRSASQYREIVRSGLEEVEHLIRLAEDLLLLSRSAAGGTRSVVELEPLLLEVVEMGIRLGRASGVTVRAGAVTPGAVLAEPIAIERALLNLVDNAVKYTPAGGLVEVSLAREGGQAVIDVRDTGFGIETADLARVFEPFVRLDHARSRATGGSGLGLAIARSIVDAHGGTLTVRSTPGGGSCFTLRLPLAPAASRTASAPEGTVRA